MAQSTLARVFSTRKLLRTDCLKYVRKQTNSAAAKPAREHSPIEKILIANRGEIACRVMQSARRMGIRSVACYSDADANSMHVSMADEANYIGPSPATESYLCMNKIIDVAKRSGAQAIHPGYGFLSEKPEFANLCEEKGITFIGPPSSAIRDMGIKSTSKEIMGKAGVPLIQGYHGDNQSDEFLAEQADKIGYPVMLKAVRGGGGKGMRVVNDASEFMPALSSARNESLKAFDDDKMLIEQLIERPRHVEVQVFADSYGNTVYLFERDCSVQRRHQKIIEEAPAPGMTEEMRREIGEAAVRAAKAVGYVGAGTVEFILDARGNFYFMEMNTRLQVEHPVTEMISGVDLVELQIRAAAGEVLPFTQEDLVLNGHSFEARIYAEDPDSNFIPGTGLLKYLSVPDQDPTIRVETGVRQGDEVSQFYDPMIAKLVVWDRDRQTALRKLVNKLKQYHIVGLKTNIPFLLSLATHESFITADVHTGFIEEHYASLFPPKAPLTGVQLAQAAFALSLSKSASLDKRMNEVQGYQVNVTGGSKLALTHQGKDTEVTLLHEKDGSTTIKVGDEDFSCCGHLGDDGTLHINVDGKQEKIDCFVQHGSVHMFADEGAYCVEQQRPKFILEASDKQLPDGAVAPMTGSILQVLVKAGDTVKSGQTVAVIYAMKLEHSIVAGNDGVVKEVFVQEGGMVNKGDELVDITKSS